MMSSELLAKAKELLNRNLMSTTLSTVDKNYNVNIAVVSVLEMIDNDTIICARFGADLTYANLKATGKGVFLVLLTDNISNKDGIRVYVELADDLTAGPYFDRIQKRLDGTPYHKFILKNCLVFKITGVAPVSTLMIKKEV